MTAKSCIALLSVGLALTACHNTPGATPAASETPEPNATVTQASAAVPPTPLPGRTEAFSVTPQSTPCGAEKLQNYLNLMPTSTAKDEIVRSLGHNRIRFVSLQQAKGEPSPGSTRVTAAIGVDGRIKEFACG